MTSKDKYGDTFSTDVMKVFAEGDFCGPFLHVGSKINKEDEKARAAVPRFRGKIAERMKEGKEILGIDMFDGFNVDIVADLTDSNLFEGELEKYRGYFKTVYASAFLEHVSNPFLAAQNMHEFLAPGGKVYYAGPWVWGYHAYPDDYWRISISGLKALFPGYEWEDWWYSGTVRGECFRIKDVNKERAVFQEMKDSDDESIFISDRTMPYLLVNAIGVKPLD